MGISNLNFKAMLDATGFQAGATLTRTELNQIRSAMRDAVPESQRLQQYIDAMGKAVGDQKLTVEQAEKAIQKFAQKLPGVSAELAAGKEIMSQYKTPMDAYRERLEKLDSLLQKNLISQRAYNSEVAKARGALVSNLSGLANIPVVGDLVSKVTGLAAMHPALAATSVVTGAAALALKTFRSEAERITDISRSASRLDISIEAYQVLGKVAKKAGSDISEVGPTISRMNRTIGDAAAGIGGEEKQIGFRRLGLDVQQLVAMKPEQAFLTISDALRGIANPMERASIASKIFGEESGKLNAVLGMGTEKFNQIRDAMNANGSLISGDAAARMEAAKVAFDQMGKNVQILQQNFAIAASGGMNSFLTALNNIISGTEKLEKAGIKKQDRTADDRSKNLGEIGGILADLVALPMNMASETEEPWMWARMKQRLAKEAKTGPAGTWSKFNDENNPLAGTLTQRQIELNQQFEATQKEMEQARARRDEAAVARAGDKIRALMREREEAEQTARAEQKANEEAAKHAAEQKKLDDERKAASKTFDEYIEKLNAETGEMQLSSEAARIYTMAKKAGREEEAKGVIAKREAADAAKKAKEAFDSTRDSFDNQARLWQLTGGHVEQSQRMLAVYQAQLKGVSGQELESLRAKAQWLDAQDLIKKVMEESRGPVEKYQEQVRRLNEAHRLGMNDQTFQQGMKKANEELRNNLLGNLPKPEKKPVDQYADSLQGLWKAWNSGAFSRDPLTGRLRSQQEALAEFAKYKEAAAKQLEKPISINTRMLGIEMAFEGTKEAIDKIETYRLEEAARARQEREKQQGEAKAARDWFGQNAAGGDGASSFNPFPDSGGSLPPPNTAAQTDVNSNLSRLVVLMEQMVGERLVTREMA